MANQHYIVKRNNTVPNTGATYWGIWICDTYAGRPVTGLVVGEMGIMLDTNDVMFASSTTTWAGQLSLGQLTVPSLLLSSTAGNYSLLYSVATTLRLIGLPDTGGTLVEVDYAQTLGNKTFPDASTYIVDEADQTKKWIWSLGGATTGKTVTVISSHTDNRSITLPDATGTVVLNDNTATLSNKTLTTPTIASFANAAHNHSNAAGGGAIPLSSVTNLASGTYTPTLTNVANLDSSTAYGAQYLRVGNTVTVSGALAADPTLTTTTTQLGISLPIASNLGAGQDCVGVGSVPSITGLVVTILGDAANNRAEMNWKATDITNQAYYYHYTYQII